MSYPPSLNKGGADSITLSSVDKGKICNSKDRITDLSQISVALSSLDMTIEEYDNVKLRKGAVPEVNHFVVKYKGEAHDPSGPREIGRGEYGNVYSYAFKEGEIAIKFFTNPDDKEIQIVGALEEGGIMGECELIPSKIVTISDVHGNPSSKYKVNVMERVDGNLTQFNNDNSDITFLELLQIAKQLTKMLKCLEEKGYFYTDIKPDNILYSCDNETESGIRLHIGDTGSIHTPNEIPASETCTKSMGTFWMESVTGDKNVFNEIKCRTPFVIYGLGVTLMDLFLKKGMSPPQIFWRSKKIEELVTLDEIQTKFNEEFKNLVGRFTEDENRQVVELLEQMVQFNWHENKITMDEIILKIDEIIENINSPSQPQLLSPESEVSGPVELSKKGIKKKKEFDNNLSEILDRTSNIEVDPESSLKYELKTGTVEFGKDPPYHGLHEIKMKLKEIGDTVSLLSKYISGDETIEESDKLYEIFPLSTLKKGDGDIDDTLLQEITAHYISRYNACLVMLISFYICRDLLDEKIILGISKEYVINFLNDESNNKGDLIINGYSMFDIILKMSKVKLNIADESIEKGLEKQFNKILVPWKKEANVEPETITPPPSEGGGKKKKVKTKKKRKTKRKNSKRRKKSRKKRTLKKGKK